MAVIFTNPELIKKFKQITQSLEKNNFEDIDPIMRNVVKRLMVVPDLATVYSCEGHSNSKVWHTFYLMFVVGEEGFIFLSDLFMRLQDELIKTSGDLRPNMISLSFTPRRTDVLLDNSNYWYTSVILSARTTNEQRKEHCFKVLNKVLQQILPE